MYCCFALRSGANAADWERNQSSLKSPASAVVGFIAAGKAADATGDSRSWIRCTTQAAYRLEKQFKVDDLVIPAG